MCFRHFSKRFLIESGGLEKSAYAAADRMIEWFGAPRVSIEALIDRVVADVK